MKIPDTLLWGNQCLETAKTHSCQLYFYWHFIAYDGCKCHCCLTLGSGNHTFIRIPQLALWSTDGSWVIHRCNMINYSKTSDLVLFRPGVSSMQTAGSACPKEWVRNSFKIITLRVHISFLQRQHSPFESPWDEFLRCFHLAFYWLMI